MFSIHTQTSPPPSPASKLATSHTELKGGCHRIADFFIFSSFGRRERKWHIGFEKVARADRKVLVYGATMIR